MIHPRKREHHEDGRIANHLSLLEERGFGLECWVQRKKDKAFGQIRDVKENTVVLNIESGPLTGLAQVNLDAFLKGEWRAAKPPAETQELEGFQNHTAQHCHEGLVKVTVGVLVEKLTFLEGSHISVYDGLKVMLKPSKNIVTTKSFAPKKLVLVPTTLKVEVREDPPAGYVSVGRVGTDMSFCLGPMFVLPTDGKTGFVSPFWLVRQTHKSDEANVELSTVIDPTDKNSKMSIPVLVNPHAIAEGTVLMRYVAKPPVETEELVPLASKRRRTKGS